MLCELHHKHMLSGRKPLISNSLHSRQQALSKTHSKPAAATGKTSRVQVAALEQAPTRTVYVDASELKKLILLKKLLRKENEALRQAIAFYSEVNSNKAFIDDTTHQSTQSDASHVVSEYSTVTYSPAKDIDTELEPAYEPEEVVDAQDEGVAEQVANEAPDEPPAVQAPPRLLDIVFVAAEAAPFSKTGGLGDVMGSLPVALAERGHRVMVVVPRYLDGKNADMYKSMTELPPRPSIDLWGGGKHDVGYFHLHRDNVDWVFVDHVSYHRKGCTPYGTPTAPFADNLFRFALLSMAALEAPLVLHVGGFRRGTPPGYPYGQDVVFVANDWHTAMVPVYLQARYKPHGVYKNARCIMAIHNMAFQGTEPISAYRGLGLTGDWWGALHWVPPNQPKEQYINILKAGLVTADKLVTVSQGYAAEILGAREGLGLEPLLRERVAELRGIVNGVSMQEWDPSNDEHIAETYDVKDLNGKQACKAALQEEMGLPYRPRVPLLGFIGRLDYQKGPDMVLEALGHLANMDVQVVMLGSGAKDYEDKMKRAMEEYPRNFAAHVGFSVPLAHRILAGCDILLMPSRFEPCGLNQLYAMRYGTIPIAHSTGGLRDTIEDHNPFSEDPADMGTGWTFSPATMDAMLDTVRAALRVLRKEPDRWQALQVNGMVRDFSWTSSAQQYETMLIQAVEEQRPSR